VPENKSTQEDANDEDDEEEEGVGRSIVCFKLSDASNTAQVAVQETHNRHSKRVIACHHSSTCCSSRRCSRWGTWRRLGPSIARCGWR
jgi:hypothetical protein